MHGYQLPLKLIILVFFAPMVNFSFVQGEIDFPSEYGDDFTLDDSTNKVVVLRASSRESFILRIFGFRHISYMLERSFIV